MNEKKVIKPDRTKGKLKKVSDHLRLQNKTLQKMLDKLSVVEDQDKEHE
jgi:hypothetical protein